MKYCNNIIIQDKMYALSSESIASGYHGTCYHLQKDNLDLAVKIYHQESAFAEEKPYHPSKEVLTYFTVHAKEMYPILLSEYLVMDEANHYVGCACPYVEETKGVITKALWTLAPSVFLTYFYRLEEAFSKLAAKNIMADPIHIYNMKLGKIKDKPTEEHLYCFDDTGYLLGQNMLLGSAILNPAIEDLVFLRLWNQRAPAICQKILRNMWLYDNYLDFFEENSHSYETMETFMADYEKQQIKNSYKLVKKDK